MACTPLASKAPWIRQLLARGAQSPINQMAPWAATYLVAKIFAIAVNNSVVYGIWYSGVLYGQEPFRVPRRW